MCRSPRSRPTASSCASFLTESFNIQGEYVPVQLGFKDLIFVIEDVDAASKVVKRRSNKEGLCGTVTLLSFLAKVHVENALGK